MKTIIIGVKLSTRLGTFPSENKMFSCLTWVLFQKANVIGRIVDNINDEI